MYSVKLFALPVRFLRLSLYLALCIAIALVISACQNSEFGSVVQRAIAPDVPAKLSLPTPANTPLALPANFPKDIPQPRASQLTAVQQEKFVTWRTTQAFTEVARFYQQQLQIAPWQISASQNSDRQISLFAKSDQWLLLVAISANSANQTEVSLSYMPVTTPSPPTPLPSTDPLAKYINDLNQLAVLQISSDLDLAAPVLRREYVRWLVRTNNRLHHKRPSRQVRLASPQTNQATFDDVPNNDPDFAEIQGLANAGFLAQTQTFRPDQPLTREEMIHLKIPFDLGQFPPPATLADVQSSWQFQDSAMISSFALRAIAADAKLGENSNIRRSFGFITILQPQSHPSRREALASLWYFGTGIEGISIEQFLQAQNNAK
jgi:hypothetical protein